MTDCEREAMGLWEWVTFLTEQNFGKTQNFGLNQNFQSTRHRFCQCKTAKI
jgi:hypothetical protein